MKRWLGSFLLVSLLLMVTMSPVWAAGSCTQSLNCYHSGQQCVLSYVCTGAASDGSFASMTNGAVTTARLTTLNKYFLYTACSDPGSTAPTASWDYTLTDGSGRDILGGLGANHSATATECFVPKIDTTNGVYGATPWNTSLLLAITGNSEASAQITFYFTFVRE